MKARLLLLWDRIHSSYWFLPGLLLLTGAGAALGMTALDRRVDADSLAGIAGVYAGGPEGARSVLLAVASSVLGVAGTTFSITIAVLSLTSSQFGPRLLRNFLKDTGNQIVLGTFIGTFLYALLVLRTVRSADESAFVPHLSVTLGLALAVMSVVMLVYFIQHTVASIQASQIIEVAGDELIGSIGRLYPSEIGTEEPDPPSSAALASQPRSTVRATRSGYLQAVDGDALIRCAAEHDQIIQLLRIPGEFIAAGSVIALLTPARAEDEERQGRVEGALSIGAHPTPVQDLSFSVNQLAEIATRALSPGINDPNTAMMCVDRLGAGLCLLAQREMPSSYRADEDGRLRLIARVLSFADVLHQAFGQIRRYGRGDAEVLTRILQVLLDVASCARSASQRAALAHQAALVLAESRDGLAAEEAKRQVAEQHRRTSAGIESSSWA